MDNEIDLNQFIPNVRFELIPIKNLVSNQDYQRNLSIKHVQKAAAHFDLRQINPVKVSRRGGINYVFNGQHTIEIIALVSGSRETPVWCMIYDDLIYEEEADIFANQLKYTKALSPYEIFMANVEAGNDTQLTIKALIESYDLILSAKSAPGNICAISTVEDIYQKYGFHVLDRTIRLIASTWEGEQKSFSANMLSGVARLINCFGNTLKDTIFIEKLGMISIKELSRTAKDRHAGSLGYSEAMLIFYNKKNTGGLQMEKLYAKNKLPASLDEDKEIPRRNAETESTSESQMSLFEEAQQTETEFDL